MRNFEKYEEEIKLIGGSFAVNRHTNRIVSCNEIKCDDCIFNEWGKLCKDIRIIWLYSEYTERLTKRERLFCELMGSGWIVRVRDEEDGYLCWYAVKPKRVGLYWSNENETDYAIIDGLNLKFNFIKWEDKEPWSVEDLLRLEVLNE